MPIITSVTRPAESGSTNSGEFAINGLPIQIQASGNTVGNDLQFDGDGLSLGPDTAAAGTVTGVSVNGGPAQTNINPNGVLLLATPTGTLRGVTLNGVAGSVDPQTGIATVNIVTNSGTVTSVVLNGVNIPAVNGVVTLSAGTTNGVTINGGALISAVHGVINLTGIGSTNGIIFEGQTYTPNPQGFITLATSSSSTSVKSVAVNGGAGVQPNVDGLVNLGNIGTVRRVVINGLVGTPDASGVVTIGLPVGGINSVSINGGIPVSGISGNISLTGIGTVKSVTVNNTTVTPVNGNVNLGSLGTLTGVTVNDTTAVVTNGNAVVTIPVGTGTVTGVKINGGATQSPTAGVVNLTIPEPADVVKRISVSGQLLTPVNGTLTLTLPSGSTGSVSSVSVNGGGAITADVLGNVALTNIGSANGVSVNGGPAVQAVNGTVILTGIGTVSGVTVNGGAVLTATNGRVNLTNIGRVNRVIVNTVEAIVDAAGVASVTIPIDSNAVKTISLNGGVPMVPVNGNVNVTLPSGSTAANAITGITVNSGAKVVGTAGVAVLSGLVTQIRHNGNILTSSNGEVILNTGTITAVTVNNGPALPVVNGTVDITVSGGTPGATSASVNGGPAVGAVNGNIFLTGIGNVTGATINGGAVIASVGGKLNLLGVGTVTSINVGINNYTPVNGVVTLPAATAASGVSSISVNGGTAQSGDVNLLVGTLTGVTVNGTVATVVNGRASVTLAALDVPVKGVSVDGSQLTPNAQGVVNVSLAGLARTVSFLGETQNVAANGTLALPTTVGTVKAITINSGAQIAPVNGILNLVLPSGSTPGIQSLVVNGAAVTPNNGVATFSTPQGTVTGITLNGSVVQAPVNGVVALSVTASTSGVQSVSLNNALVVLNGTNGNANIVGVVTSVSVNGGTPTIPNPNGLVSITTPTNFIKTISINGGAAQAPDVTSGNYNIVLPSGSTSGVQAVSLNNGAPVYPANGIVNLSFSAATNYVRSLVINGVAGSPDVNTGVVTLTIPAGDSNVKSVSINGGTKYSADTLGNINVAATLGSGTVTGIQVNGAAVQTPNGTGTLVLTGVGTVTGATVNGGVVIAATAGKLNLTGIGTVTTIQANGQSFAPVGGSNTVNLGTLGTVNTVSINGGAPVASVGGNVDLSGVGTVTGATVNGGAVVTATNGVLSLTVPAGAGGGVSAVSVNNGPAQYPNGGIVNLTISGGQGTVTGVTVNGGTVVSAVSGLVALTGVGTVTGATINGGPVIASVAGNLSLLGVGTVSGVTFNGSLVQTPTNGVVSLTYSPPNDTVKSVRVNGGTAQLPVNGVLNLTVPTGSTSTTSGTTGNIVRTISVNNGLPIEPNADGLAQISVGTVKSIKYNNGSNIFPDPVTGALDLGTISSTGSTQTGPQPTALTYTAGDSTLRLSMSNGVVFATTITAGSTGATVTDEIYMFVATSPVTMNKYYHDATGVYRRIGATATVASIDAADTTNWLLVASVDLYLRSKAERISSQGVRTLHTSLRVALTGATSGDTVIQNAQMTDLTVQGDNEQVRINVGVNFQSNGLDIGRARLDATTTGFTQGDAQTFVGGKGFMDGGGANVFNNTVGSWGFGHYALTNGLDYDIRNYNFKTYSGGIGAKFDGPITKARLRNCTFEIVDTTGTGSSGLGASGGANVSLTNGSMLARQNSLIVRVLGSGATMTLTDVHITKLQTSRIYVAAGSTLIMRNVRIDAQDAAVGQPVIDMEAGAKLFMYDSYIELNPANAATNVAINQITTGATPAYVEMWGDCALNGAVNNGATVVRFNSPITDVLGTKLTGYLKDAPNTFAQLSSGTTILQAFGAVEGRLSGAEATIFDLTGLGNVSPGGRATTLGGEYNSANGLLSIIAGGSDNYANANTSFIGASQRVVNSAPFTAAFGFSNNITIPSSVPFGVVAPNYSIVHNQALWDGVSIVTTQSIQPLSIGPMGNLTVSGVSATMRYRGAYVHPRVYGQGDIVIDNGVTYVQPLAQYYSVASFTASSWTVLAGNNQTTEGSLSAGGIINFATRYQEGTQSGTVNYTAFANVGLGKRVRIALHSLANTDTLTGWITFNSRYYSATNVWDTVSASGEGVVVNQTGFSFQPGVTNFIDIECVGISPVKKFEISFAPGLPVDTSAAL